MRITPAMRRETLQRTQLARQFEPKYIRLLKKERTTALKKALNELKGHRREEFVPVISDTLKEPYLRDYYARLYNNVGITLGDSALESFMSRAGVKSTPVWKAAVDEYIANYTGNRIVSVAGTFKEEVIRWVSDALTAAPEIGIEKVTQYVYDDIISSWNKLSDWQVRRIVQTETMAALGVGQDAAVRSLGIQYTKTWSATFNNTRAQHAQMDGTAVNMNEVFTLPNGDRMMFPSDYSLGASAENLINCSCGVYNSPGIIKNDG